MRDPLLIRCSQQAHLAAMGVLEAAMLPEAITDARKEVGNKCVVAGEGARDDVAVHDDVADCARGQAHALQQRPAGHLWRVQQRALLRGCMPHVQACAVITLQDKAWSVLVSTSTAPRCSLSQGTTVTHFYMHQLNICAISTSKC